MSKGITNKHIKNIFIFFICCFSLIFLIMNTNQGKNLTYKIRHNLLTRSLSETPAQPEKTTKICEKTSSNLKDYFQTGDKTLLNLEEDNTEKYDDSYIEALIEIVRHYYSKKEKKQNKNNRLLEGENNDSSGEYMKHIIKYGYHILPLVIVFGIGILSLVGWAVCCCCTCCKCKCCVCKKPKCKTPSIVLALIFYVIVALISFYSLVEQKKVFTGLADFECAVLKFTDDVLEGETNKFPPFWAGIDQISTILTEFNTKTQELSSTNILNDLSVKKGTSDGNKNDFENDLKTGSDNIYSSYKKQYNGKEYQLDIAKQFGKCDFSANTFTADNSVCKLWFDEYEKITSSANDYMTLTDTSFTTIFNGNAYTDFQTGISKMGEIKKEFLSLKTLISDQILEKADDIDRIGNLVYTLFFTFLMIFCGAITIFMLLLCCCSGELCTNLSCFQCFCKFFLHFFWNLMALVMFILFMGGSLFTITGTLGNDLVNVVSYLISEDNLGTNADTIILGKVKKYLNKCFNSNGNILSELGLVESDMNSFEKLKEAKLQMEELKNQFNDKLYKFVYSEYKDELTQRIEYKSDELKLVPANGDNIPFIEFNTLLQKFNSYASTNNKKENWDITTNSEKTCDNTNKDEAHTDPVTYHPSKCYPIIKSWSTAAELSDEKEKLNDIQNFINIANSDTDPNSIKKILEGLGRKYNTFLENEIKTLDLYIQKISTYTNITMEYTSEDDELFSFMNCNFIKDNVNVILYYLKHSFENDIYEIGVYSLIAAFSLPFGISFTILLIMISNDEIEKNKEKENKLKEKDKNKMSPLSISDVKVDKNDGNNTEQRPLNNHPN